MLLAPAIASAASVVPPSWMLAGSVGVTEESFADGVATVDRL